MINKKNHHHALIKKNVTGGANSEENLNEAIGFTMIDGLISNPFKTIASQIDEDHIKTEYYNMDDILLFEMIVSRNGELGFQSISSESKLLEYGKTFGWWSRADDCFGQFHNVTGSNIGNWLFWRSC